MKTLDFLTKNAIALITVLFLTECGGASKKDDSSDGSLQAQSENFSLKLGKNFNSYDDYTGYIVATVMSGSISTGQEVDGVRNDDFADRTPLKVTEIKNSGGAIVQSAKAGEEVTLTFKTTSSKNISMSFNGAEYSIVNKGLNPEEQQASTTQPSTDNSTCVAKLSIDGQNWQAESCDNQFWINGNTIVKKGPFMLLKFTKANEKMSTKSEYLMIQVNTNAKAPKSYSGKDLEVSFQGYVADKEVYYGRVPSDKQSLSLDITSFEESNGNAKIAGKLNGKLKRITCADCKDEVAVDLNFQIASVKIYTEK
jgi:hypothetical protein